MPAVDSAVVLAVAAGGCAMAVGATVMEVSSVFVGVVSGESASTEPHGVLTEVEEGFDGIRLKGKSGTVWIAPWSASSVPR